MKSMTLFRLLAAAAALSPALNAKEPNHAAALPPATHEAMAERVPDVPAKPVKYVTPKYPRELNNRGIRGRVVVRFVVDTKGRVQNPEVLKSDHAAFERPALEAIRGWRFSPAIQDGKPVKMRVQVPLEFLPRTR